MSNKLFESKFGYFTPDGREYVITNPYTKRPWVNVISNGDYSIIVSHTGSGYSWRGNAGQNRITRLYQDLIRDNWGKYLYIRDLDTNKFWSATWKPVMKEYQLYEVRHGLGYSIFSHKVSDIYSTLKVFVVKDAPVEIMILTLKNESDRRRRLDVTSYFEWVLGNFPDEHREFHKLFVNSVFNHELNSIIVEKYLGQFPDEKGIWNNTNWDHVAFHSCSKKIDSFDCDKETFLGMYGELHSPKSMFVDELARTTGRFTDPIASLRVSVELEPNESETIVFTIGVGKIGEENIEEFIKKYNSVENANREFERVKEFWKEFLEKEYVDTPDPAFNIFTNYWSKYQAISGRLWAKSGYYQVSSGYGYRDQLQDSLIFLGLNPEFTKKQILLHASQQFNKGDVLHWWFTIKGGGPRTNCSDDFLWLPFITIQYLKETNDFTILDEEVPFLDGGKATLYEHCKRAIEHSFSMFSPRGIPLMGDHDWNDGLSALGHDLKGESFWVAEFLYYILNDFSKISEFMKDEKFAQKQREVMESLKDSFEKFGWDGEWYLQATTDNWEKVGSKENEEGKIYLNPQIWAVISGIADKERVMKAMDSVKKYLLKDYGALLLYPAYTKPRSDIGYITRYAPGLRENGGTYTHAATWAVWAFSLIKDPETAFEAYRRICPPNRSNDIEKYWAEPYVTPGNIDGPQSPYYGRGGWTWYTGSAQWLHRVAVNWILGIRADYDGLIVDPVIPKDWKMVRYKRLFRGSIYNITIENKSGNSYGVKRIIVDGKEISGNKIPDFSDGKIHEVVVEI
ncbi:MAG: glycosyl transferase family 36 [Thermosipho sp. (in: Bacteria)]|nr:glycosyl transferase family 36 [Thermosipho sp. (in: thermotogales)]